MEDRKNSEESGDVPDKALYNLETSVKPGSKWSKIRNLRRAGLAFRNSPFRRQSRPSSQSLVDSSAVRTHRTPMWDGYTGIESVQLYIKS